MTLNKRNSLLLFGVLSVSLLAAEAWTAGTIQFALHPYALAVAITADVAIGVPLLYYVLLARKRYLPVSGVFALYFLALSALRFILPSTYQSHLRFVDVLLPLAELGALTVVILKVRGITKHVRRARASEIYFVDALRNGVQRALGESLVSRLVATEVTVLYFAIFGWFTCFRNARADQRVFSYHRLSIYVGTVCSMMLLLMLEIIVVHLLIQMWSVRAAWIFTALGIYSLLWILGYYQATRLQPIVVDSDSLYLRAGIRWRAKIALSTVVDVRRPTSEDLKTDSYVNAAVFGKPRLVLCLNELVVMTDFFGRARHASVIGLTVDNIDRFQACLRQRTNT